MKDKILSIILSLTVVFSVFAVSVSAKTSEEADTHLQFNEDGTFRIMQISDLQDFFPMKSITKKVLRKSLESYKVDLIVLTGDNISSSSIVKPYALLAINEFMSIFEKYGIPVVMTFGNHDDENTTASKEFQIRQYEKYKCFIGCAGEDLGSNNLCTYYVPIYSSKDCNDMLFNIWMIDSCTYNDENDLGGYGCVTKKQIEWYKNKSEELERKYNRKIPSIMFQHIVVPEIWDALVECNAEESHISHNGKYYRLPENTKGSLNETPCPPNYSNGQFQAVLDRSDVLAMCFGHDHTNTFEIDYKGIKLINTAGMGFNSYNGEEEGFRLFTLNEEDPRSFDTESVTYWDMFDYNNDVDRLDFYRFSSTVDTKTNIISFFQYIFALLRSIV